MTELGASAVWTPSADYLAAANVLRLGRRHGIDTIAELRIRSVADIGWYWGAVVDDLRLEFRSPYRQVLDVSRGIEFPNWFVGGRLNLVDSCVSRWSADPTTAATPAVVHEAEDGSVTTLTYGELDAAVRRAAAGLRRLGVGRGDAVALYLPMIPEAVVAFYATVSLGAIAVPLFSGFAPGAIASRVQDAAAHVVVTAAATTRRGRQVALRANVDEAMRSCPSVEHVVVVGLDADIPSGDGPAALAWSDLLADEPTDDVVESVDAMDVLLLAYTSGTTARPKGAVHTHAGFLVKTASEVAYSFDFSAGGVFCWITDMGWIMGPLSIVGTHANGGTLLLYEGSPDVPDHGRLWSLVERHSVSMLGVSPTLIRTLRSHPAGAPSGQDLSSVHTIGSTGEPWDPDAYAWLADGVFAGRPPVINFSGGTEVGGSFLAPYPVEPITPCSVGGPSLGMDVDVVDAAGNSVRGAVGELICRQPWPSMTRELWRDRERYLESYWTAMPGVWQHGDFALVDDDGHWYILGRSDDVMNVAGKRLASAEVESILAAHPDVAEVAAVGVPDPVKGEALWVFWVESATVPAERLDAVAVELRELVADQLGKPFAPSRVMRLEQLPKTRSAKILRRAMRAAAAGTDPGDLSGAENPDAIDDLRAALARQV